MCLRPASCFSCFNSGVCGAVSFRDVPPGMSYRSWWALSQIESRTSVILPAADAGHEALVAAAALLQTALQSASTGSHCPLLAAILAPLATLLQAATHHLRHCLSALPCSTPWPDARPAGESPTETLRRFQINASAGHQITEWGTQGMVTSGRVFERTSVGAAKAAAAAVELIDACVALAFDACDRCVQLRDGAGDAMDAMDMRRTALVVGMGVLPRALGRQSHHHRMCAIIS